MVLKGVNRSIIEISGAGSEYFERAQLFVRPEYANLSPSRLQNGAKDFLSELEKQQSDSIPKYQRRAEQRALKKGRKLRKWVVAVLCIAALAAYTAVVRMI